MRAPPAFAGLTVVVLALAVAGAIAAAGGTGSDEPAVGVQTDVPDLRGFDEPESEGAAVVDADGERETYDSVQSAVDAADPGATVRLAGRFDERVTVETAGLTIAAAERGAAVIDGGGEDDVLRIDASNVTVERVWIRNSGWGADDEDAGVVLNGTGATVRSVRLTEITFGVWVDGVDDVTVENNTIVGREAVESHVERGNGVQLWETSDVEVRGNDVTRVRDGLYFSWAEGVDAVDNRLWNLRYGVHYMYSDDNRLARNVAFGNDIGYALMVSENLRIENNTAVDNRGRSGYGIMVKDIEQTAIRGNVLAGNGKGVYTSNSLENRLVGNLLLENDVGAHATAGTDRTRVVRNSFVRNDVQAFTTRNDVIAWNGTDEGNYWSDARTADLSGDGLSETRHRPAGTVEQLVSDHPGAAVFAESPAFSVVRLAEDSFPVLESPGVVDHRPATEPYHGDWRDYYAHRSD